ncbi:efflux RND transporter periplasmic adaptor subunit [Shewanella sp. CG12_big_fil_rev_8_21_14_0_65_47_15]|uniref:efflux RND transporter periplasmic adaptor subunit n=1 Tax=Shewanella sp. CG12_big_fil_rev_8_21_14_0_65_47_15 TaxID=1975537 RepID=UPI000CAC70B1|nr:efflux RND transporter periplasmic adaptor subunit [Shewanella sp. CG12_big_fil_rev_8_21_14_0_65_47_15]PIW60710.1 MAG: efflux RND transporter periplasmic adaptor subunit [Shewanella sp. CG12_big_fil_rev_8_21_14_0_65_47_15]
MATIPRVLLVLLAFSGVQVHAASLETMEVMSKPYANWVTLDATIEAVKAATVSAQTSGRIIKLNYDVNDVVPEGAALLEITSKEQGAELASFEADLAKARALNVESQAQYKRYKELFPQGAISKGAMDEATANAKATEQAVSAAQARVIKATESLKYTVVSAPFSGIVTERFVQLGETVSPGQPLLSGFSANQMRAITQVPQCYINQLKNAPEFIVRLSDGRELTSRDLIIFSFADPVSHSYQVRINLPENEANLQPGTWAKASFKNGEREKIQLPVSALITMNELSSVYLKQGEVFVLTQVRVGEPLNGEVEVLAGLKSGDTVAMDAYQVLLNKKQ